MRVPLSQRLPQGRVRDHARGAALNVLSVAERLRATEHSPRPGVHFIYLHGVEPGEEDSFRKLIRYLRQGHRLISYDEGVRRVRQNRKDGAYACFSFDDGFASCLTAGSILEEEGLTACFFICPGLVGMDRSDLVHAFPGGLGGEERTMTWPEIESLRDKGHEVGSHTMTHPVLANCEPEDLVYQVVRSREEIKAQLGHVDHFAWPRGRFHHFSAPGAREVANAGYLSCASAERGFHSTLVGEDGFPCIRREHVMLSWPAHHIQYFIAKSKRRASPNDNDWPAGWML